MGTQLGQRRISIFGVCCSDLGGSVLDGLCGVYCVDWADWGLLVHLAWNTKAWDEPA